jgi:hypothetical protein
LWHGSVNAQPELGGCCISDGKLQTQAGNAPAAFAFNVESGPISNGSGNKTLDRALARTLSMLSDRFDVLPGFAFFGGGESRNAFASTSHRLGRSDGSVIFGVSLLNELLAIADIRETGVAAVCAHEFAHILQYKRGIDKILVGADRRVKRLELHADYLAGYFAGGRKRANPSFPAVAFAQSQDRFGDDQFGDPNHHGTSKERGAAVVAGFNASYHDGLDLNGAVQSGLSYVQLITG